MPKTAIITGAGSGIGRATAFLLASRGYQLALIGRRQEALSQTLALCPGSFFLLADVSNAGACQDVISQSQAKFGDIDVLINNAGFAPLHAIDKTTPAIIDQAYSVNALAPAYLIHHIWPIFTRQNHGCIINLSTMGTIDPFPGFFAYAAAKASVNLMARSCANEGKRHNIRAFAVAPGAVETPMLRANFAESRLPRHRVLAPEAVAQIILDCIEGKRDAENGKTILVPSPS